MGAGAGTRGPPGSTALLADWFLLVAVPWCPCVAAQAPSSLSQGWQDPAPPGAGREAPACTPVPLTGIACGPPG